MNVHHSMRAVLIAAACAWAVIGCHTPSDELPADNSPAIADGIVVEVDDDLIYFLWDGGRQRIQQPAALSAADLVKLGLVIGEVAPTTLTVGSETTRFVVHPADGPTARIYLVQAGTLHEIDLVQATYDPIADLRDLEEVVVDRVQIP